jgi:hypothetical protein
MAYSYIEYTAGGSATFNIPFEYINQSEIEVFVDGTAATFTFTSANTVNVTPTPTSGATVRIERTTDLTNRAVDFASGSVLTEEDLDNSNIQVYHAAQEAIDKAEAALSLDADGKFDGEVNGSNRVIKNVADPVNAQDVATKNYIENTWLSPSDKAQLNAIDTTKLHTVANDIANVNTTAGSIANVNTVGGAISNVNTVAGSIANVNTTATNIADVNTVATNIADINTVENSIVNVNTTATNIADVNTVAANIGDINTVENSIANVNKVGTDIANVNTTAGSIANVNTVATNVADVNTTAGAIANVNAVGGNIANVNAVAGNATNINAVQANETNINAVNANSGNINTVAGNNTNVTTVANNIADVSLAATNISDIQTIATEVAKVVTVANDLNEATSEIDVVAASIANVDAVGNDIANVNTVATNLTSINAFADTYFIAATAPSSPTEGDLWFDTTNDLMMVYNGGSWQNAGSSVNGTAARFKFVATASQTAFSGTDANGATLAYDSGYIDVYLNGVHLDPSDYTATDGSTITLASGAAAGDELYVVAFGTFTLATHYTKTEVDGLLAGVDATALKDSSGNTVVDASSGNVGIGTSSPASDAQLTISNGGGADVALMFNRSATGQYDAAIVNTGGHLAFKNGGDVATVSGLSERMRIDNIGDISFYEDTGTTPKFFWDASAESLGIGTSNPSSYGQLTLYKDGANDTKLALANNGNGGGTVAWTLKHDTAWDLTLSHNAGIGGQNLIFGTKTSGGESMRIDSAGRVTMPYQPAFTVYANTNTADGWLMSGTSGTFAACDTIVTNIGNGYSIANNRFTAPVAGTYQFTVNMSLHGTDGTLADNSLGYGFLKNGSKLNWNSYDGGLNNTVSASNFTSSNAIEISGPHITAIITLAQSDYIQFGWQNMSKDMGVRSMVFSGFLIG